MSCRRPTPIFLALVSMLAAPALAQTARRFAIPAAGEALDSIADLDGDGQRDLLIGIPSANKVEIHSGRNGGLLGTLRVASAPLFTVAGFGRAVVAVGDVDGDGLEDIAVGAPLSHSNPPTGFDNGRAYVFSGASSGGVHTQLAVIQQKWGFTGYVCPTPSTYTYGFALASIGDVTGDGRSDLAIGSPSACPGGLGGHVESWDLSTQPPTQLGSIFGGGNWQIGFAMCGLRDVIPDGGLADLAVAVPGDDSVRIFGGLDVGSIGGTAIGAWTVLQGPSTQFGFAVASPGDVDGDGVDDLVVGAPGITRGGAYYVYTGATFASGAPSNPIGPPVQTLASRQRLGCSVSGIGDHDGDGVPDFVLGAEGSQTGSSGYVRVISSASFTTLATITSPTGSPTFGVAVSETGNSGGASGRPPFMVADPGAGLVYVY